MQLKQTSFKENCFSFFFYCAVYRKLHLRTKQQIAYLKWILNLLSFYLSLQQTKPFAPNLLLYHFLEITILRFKSSVCLANLELSGNFFSPIRFWNDAGRDRKDIWRFLILLALTVSTYWRNGGFWDWSLSINHPLLFL